MVVLEARRRRLDNFSIDTLQPMVGAFGRAHAKPKRAARTDVHLAGGQGEALWPPPAGQVLGLGPGLEHQVARRIKDLNQATKVVVLSTRRDRKTVVGALRCGVSAFLLKSGPSLQLLEAFDQILDGGIYVSPSLELDKIFSPGQRSIPDDPLESLSAREYQVFSLLVEGTRAKEIAARLDLSPKTVDTYRASLMRKVDIHDVASLVKFAIQRDLTSTR